MSTLDLPYKTTFAAQIRSIEPSDTDVREAKASLNDLKAMLPAGIDPEADPQLLYIAANLYVAGMVNLNDDGVDIDTSLAAYRGFEKQQINIEHNRNRIAGYILHAGLSEFGSDRLITADEAREAGKPFNVAVVAVLWKVANRELCDFLAEASNPLHPDYKALSLSFEVGFSSYNIGVINAKDRVISAASRLVRPEDADFETMAKRLRAYGGSGKLSDDEGVYQILSGTFLPLGGGIVRMPAAAVKGITAITQGFEDKPDGNANPVDNPHGFETEQSIKPKEPDPEKEIDEEDDEEVKEDKKRDKEDAEDEDSGEAAGLRIRLSNLLAILDISALCRTTLPESRVSDNTPLPITQSNMKSLKEIKEKVASANKLEDYQQVVAGILEIAQALEDASVRMSDELEAEKNRGLEIEKARAEAAAANETLKTDLEGVKTELDTIKAQQVAAQAESLFNERMAQIDEAFELSDEDRKYIVEEIQGLEAEAFVKWMDKNVKSVRREKTKAHLSTVAAAKQKAAEELAAALKGQAKASVDEDAVIKEALASAQANNVSAPLVNGLADNAKSLVDQIKAEFEDSVTIGGKKISEYGKKD